MGLCYLQFVVSNFSMRHCDFVTVARSMVMRERYWLHDKLLEVKAVNILYAI